MEAFERQKAVRRNIATLFVVQPLSMGFCLTIPTIVGFWQENGLSMFEVMALQAFFSIAWAVLEVPAGYIADLVSRRLSLIVGALCFTAGSFTYAVGGSFEVFMLAELLMAFGLAFKSGADQALLYDSLLELNEIGRFSKLQSWQSSTAMAFSAVGCVIGAYLAGYGLRVPIVCATGVVLLSVIATAFLVEPARRQLEVKKGYVGELWNIGRSVLWSNGLVRWLVWYSATTLSFLQAALWLYQPYLKEGGVPIQANGWIFALLNVFAAAVASQAYRIEKTLGFIGAASLGVSAIVVSFVWMGWSPGQWAWMSFFLHQFVRAMNPVMFSALINREIGSDIRATALSLKSMCERLYYICVLLVAGWLVDAFGLITGIQMLAVLSFAAGAAVLCFRPGREVVKHDEVLAPNQG